MRQFFTYLLLTVLGLVFLSGCQAQKASIRGPQGEIAYKVTLPDGFDPTKDQCPMVILMHGIFSSKDYIPMPEKELAEARAVWDYVQSLPYVNGVGLLGHSQGGVIASMAAGRLAAESPVPAGVVLIAPGSVIKEACQGGKFFNAKFDPKNPPEYIRCWGLYKLGREYLVTTQQLDIYGTAAAYKGPVLLLHGDRDGIVPMWCSERYLEAYGSHATLKVVEGENHTITRRRKQVVAETVEFFRGVFGR